MKIVYLCDDIPPQSYGGAGVIAYVDACALAKKGHSVSVITTTDKKDAAGETRRDALCIRTVYSNYHERWRNYKSLNNKRVVKEVDRILNAIKPDVIHAHNVHKHLSFKILEVSRKYTENVFLTAHDAMLVHYGKFVPTEKLKISEWKNLIHYKLRYNPFRTSIIRKYLRSVSMVLAVSESLKEFLVVNGVKRVRVLHNGIDVEPWKTLDRAIIDSYRNKFGLQGKKVILFAGRLSGLKGGEKLVEFFKQIQKEIPEAVLLCVGKASNETKPYNFDGVIFTGQIPREEMKYLYSLSDVVAVPSLYLDPFPTITLEAMACGKPVIGTTFGGTKEAVVNGETGYVENPNANGFAEKIVTLLREERLALKLGANGRERVQKEFNLDTHIERLLACYNHSYII